VREFEEAVTGAQQRYDHRVDLVMRHALATGQWSKPVTFRDLTGREEPVFLLDPRIAAARAERLANESDEDREKRERTEAFLAEHRARMQALERG
jgi:hypothetical protein